MVSYNPRFIDIATLDDARMETLDWELDVLMSLRTLPPTWRKRSEQKDVMWIDIEKKEQSRHSNDLGEEVLLFLRRYGVRFLRVSE